MQLKQELRILLNVAGTQSLLDNWSVWKERITKYAELESANRKTVTDLLESKTTDQGNCCSVLIFCV